MLELPDTGLVQAVRVEFASPLYRFFVAAQQG
jgi:hypothetical protein